MLASELALHFHKFQKCIFRKDLDENFLQGTGAFNGIIVVDLAEVFVNFLYQLVWLDKIVAGHIPFMGKKVLIWETDDGKLGNADIEIFTYQFDGLVHIFHAEVFAHKAQEMFGPSCDHHLAPGKVYKAKCVTNQIALCSGIGAHEQCIFTAFFHFMDHQGLGIVYHLAITVEIPLIEGDEFHEDVVVENKFHPLGIFMVLVSDKSFAGKIILDVYDGQRF